MAWMKSVRGRLPQWLGAKNRHVRSADALGDFLSRHAAFIAQKCADDYCRNKVGLSHYALGEEQAYRDALAICRWEGYAAVLGGLLAVTQRQLIEAGFNADRIEPALVALYRRILAGQRPPSHRPQGWDDLVAALPGRLRAARADPPPSVLEIAAAAGRRLFEVLPIHASYREHDEPVVIGAVQFNFVGVSDRMRRELDAAALGCEFGGTR